ncbi:MAG: hypothetical protein A2X71_11800 [Thiobacillus sp. GWE1_62_9]|nr:MAG: hypothetical protein A2X71_11800 [Thiobacillus sp. GWE1_62_9]HBU29216.1 hypothetical protein [Thiobacillus sp.]
MVLGFYLHTLYFPDVARFKLFVGAILLFLAWRLLSEFAPWAKHRHAPGPAGGGHAAPDWALGTPFGLAVWRGCT